MLKTAYTRMEEHKYMTSLKILNWRYVLKKPRIPSFAQVNKQEAVASCSNSPLLHTFHAITQPECRSRMMMNWLGTLVRLATIHVSVLHQASWEWHDFVTYQIENRNRSEFSIRLFKNYFLFGNDQTISRDMTAS